MWNVCKLHIKYFIEFIFLKCQAVYNVSILYLFFHVSPVEADPESENKPPCPSPVQNKSGKEL